LVELHCFTSGTMIVPWHNIHLNEWRELPVEIPVPWFAIARGDSIILIDGGNPAALAVDPIAYWGGPKPDIEVRMSPAESCAATLADNGFDLTRPVKIVQTHLHGDHVGALAASSDLRVEEVVVARRELEYALDPDWHMAKGYAHREFNRSSIPWRLIGDDEGGWDVAGDGSVLLHHTPGHTPGHMSVEVNLPETGTVLVTGDAAYTRAHWEDRALPGLLSSTVSTVRSVRQMRELAALRDALVLFGHDMEQWHELNLGGRVFT
jgi:N-acyl homoserine lactone hydrolase